MKLIELGVDEAGRGCLAGDVFAAAVYLHDNKINHLVNDSKKLSKKKREELFEIITNNYSYGIGIATVEEIDDINILQASLLAMGRAVEATKLTPDLVMIDGNKAPKIQYKTITIIGGDSIIPAISAASIIAKVARDRYMREMSETYPEYNFSKHCAYGTKEHLQLLEKYGPCAIHRKSYEPIKQLLKLELSS